ncbi:MAG TPA: META domain-containing protein [Sphingomonas sp.]|nr:META domain-containing protein [Sphingomonas sp.]
MRLALTIIGAALLAGCAHDGVHPDTATAPPSLANTDWTIASINGAAPAAQRKAELRFTADRISGNAGCNSFGGGYTVADGTLTATQLISTKMACIGPGMDQETAVFKILGQPMTIARQSDGSITLTDNAGALTLTPAER